MMPISSRQKWHNYIFTISLFGVCVGLPFNKIVLSVSGMLLALNWIIEGRFKDKYFVIKQQKVGLLLSVLFFFLVAALLYSDNVSYGLDDLRIKLPLLLFPVVILSSPALEKRIYLYLLLCFVLAVFIVTAVNYGVFVWKNDALLDAREMSLFGSHIRLSLLVSFALFTTFYLIWDAVLLRKYFEKSTKTIKLILFVMVLWFLFYTQKAEVLTGYFTVFLCTLITFFWIFVNHWKRKKRIVLFSLLMAFAISLLFIFWNALPIPKEKLDKANLPMYSMDGGLYSHDTISSIMENGHYIHYFVCKEEIEDSWRVAKGSDLTNEHRDLFPVIIRYMTSKGLKKDAKGFSQLTDQDLKNIENEIPSAVYAKGGIRASLARVNMELQKHLERADPNGSTIQQRFEYWKAGANIITKNPILGVGVGDVQDVFNLEYDKMNSTLIKENRLHTHQQYMTFWIAGGVLLFLIFVLHIVTIFYLSLQSRSFLLFIFAFICAFSYFFEDTLETQVGATMVAFFTSILLKNEINREIKADENNISLS